MYLLALEIWSGLHIIDLSVPVISGHKSGDWISDNVEVRDVAAELSKVGEVEMSGVDHVRSVPAKYRGKIFLLGGVQHPQIWCSLPNQEK